MTSDQLGAIDLWAIVWLGPDVWIWTLFVLGNARWVGVGLVLAGVVGTRKPSRPCCRRCHYPIGDAPRGACTECGRSLDKPRAVRRDAWCVRRGPIVAGLACIAASLCLLVVTDGLVVRTNMIESDVRLRLESHPVDPRTGEFADFPVTAREFIDALVSAVDPECDQPRGLLEFLDPYSNIRSWTDLVWGSPTRLDALRTAVFTPETRERALAIAAWCAQDEHDSDAARATVADALYEHPELAAAVARWTDPWSRAVASVRRPVDLHEPFTVKPTELSLLDRLDLADPASIELSVTVEVEHADGTREIVSPLAGDELAVERANHALIGAKPPLYRLPPTPDPLHCTLHVRGEVRWTHVAATRRDETGELRRRRVSVPFAHSVRSVAVDAYPVY